MFISEVKFKISRAHSKAQKQIKERNSKEEGILEFELDVLVFNKNKLWTCTASIMSVRFWGGIMCIEAKYEWKKGFYNKQEPHWLN